VGDLEDCAYSAPRAVVLSQCDTLVDAIAYIENVARYETIKADDSAVSFVPRLFIIADGEQNHVLAGEPYEHGIRWCDPVASDGEACLVIQQASKLRGEAMRETEAGRSRVARELRFRASVLEGRLVHADWRQQVWSELLHAA